MRAITRRRTAATLVAVALAVAVAISALVAMSDDGGPRGCAPWREGTAAGGLVLEYAGYGTARACPEPDWSWRLSPRRATDPATTHAALGLTARAYRDVRFGVRMRTIDQLRRPRPNAWEVAWVVWHYTDDRHFYYLAFKPNGWELGKEDPAYPGDQRFLATGKAPRARLGEWHAIEIRQVGDLMEARADGRTLTRFRDRERPYRGGRVGIYTEDATTDFSELRITPEPTG